MSDSNDDANDAANEQFWRSFFTPNYGTGGFDPQDPSAPFNQNRFTSTTNTTPATNLFSAAKDLFGGQYAPFLFMGLSALANRSDFFNPPPAKVGYQGGIPQFVASRQQLPYVSGAENEARRLKQATLDALSTGATLDEVAKAAQRTYGISPGQIDAAMKTEGPYRRPGLGGITYFSPMQYTATGADIGRPTAGQVLGGGDSNIVNPGVVAPGTGGTSGISTLPTTPTKQTAQQVKPTPKTYSNYQVAQAIYDVLNPAGGGLGTLAQARQGAANLGVTGAQFESALMPRLSQAIREAKAQMPSATLSQIRDAAARRYGIDAATFDKAAALSPPTNKEIKQEIQATIDKPQEVAWLANTYGLDTKELSDITGFTDNQVRTYFADNKIPLPSANKEVDKFTDEQVAQALRESIAQGFNLEQSVQGAANKYGVSKEQLDRVKSQNKFATGGYMPNGVPGGGIVQLAKGRYLKGNGDGVSDSIPARFAGSGQPARLADGEFVIPARVVSELGNGSSDAGARKLYAMLDRVEQRARKSKRGKPSGADRELNKLA